MMFSRFTLEALLRLGTALIYLGVAWSARTLKIVLLFSSYRPSSLQVFFLCCGSDIQVSGSEVGAALGLVLYFML